MSNPTRKIIIVLTILELIGLILLFFLIKLVKKALDLYNAFKDKILKSHAVFLGLYLILKLVNTLI